MSSSCIDPQKVMAKPQAPPPPRAPHVDSDDDDDYSDEDDFDELDDMLDEFDTGKPPAAGISHVGAEPPIDEEWARMLQAGMADLLNDANQSPEMQSEFERLAKELQDAIATPAPAATAAATAATAAAPKAAPQLPPKAPAASSSSSSAAPKFQDRIKQTMDRMQTSNEEVEAGLAETDSENFLAEMLKSMGGGGEGGDEDFSTMLVNMMEQLTSKEILYEPMKELNEKYPEWIRKNEATTNKDDMARYLEQYHIVREIVAKFEEAGYRDENEACREYIVERMQKMQNAGAPPAELMGDMGPGMDPMADMPSDCGVQ